MFISCTSCVQESRCSSTRVKIINDNSVVPGESVRGSSFCLVSGAIKIVKMHSLELIYSDVIWKLNNSLARAKLSHMQRACLFIWLVTIRKSPRRLRI